MQEQGVLRSEVRGVLLVYVELFATKATQLLRKSG
jgi:hypothetical protein